MKPDSGCDAVLADGRVVRIRPVTPEDGPALRALHRRTSGQSIYQRFFTRSWAVADRYVDRICAAANGEHRVLVAELAGKPAGVADCYRPPGSEDAEIAMLVEDVCQHAGVGTLLLANLVARARQARIRRLAAEVLAGNARGQEMLVRSGFRVELRPPGGVITMVLDTAPDHTALRTVQEHVPSARRRRP